MLIITLNIMLTIIRISDNIVIVIGKGKIKILVLNIIILIKTI